MQSGRVCARECVCESQNTLRKRLILPDGTQVHEESGKYFVQSQKDLLKLPEMIKFNLNFANRTDEFSGVFIVATLYDVPHSQSKVKHE